MDPQSDDIYDLAVIGAGAAGMMAALAAARCGARVALFETRRVPGAKIRVSGGGRCNVLPSCATLADYDSSGSKNVVRNILTSWPLPDVHRFFEQDLGIPLKVEPTGKVFPKSDDSREVVTALLSAVHAAGVQLISGQRVQTLTPHRHGAATWRLCNGAAHPTWARGVVLATGGLSLPKTGSDGNGWALARKLGHTVRPTSAALVPLCSGDAAWHALSGISLPVRLTALLGDRPLGSYEGDMVFTHRGISGPAALNISRFYTAPANDRSQRPRIVAHFAPAIDWRTVVAQTARTSPNTRIAQVLRAHLPRRLVDTLLEGIGMTEPVPVGQLTRLAREALLGALQACDLHIDGDEGYRTAEVTAGGIPLDELHQKTLESRLVGGLYIAGEAIDVVGKLGGYNFLWAWVTGRRAGLAAARAALTAQALPQDAVA